jgi:GDP-L-fucose synthase
MSNAIAKDAPIYVAGHKGMVGSAIVRRLRSAGYENIIVRTHGALDLRDQVSVDQFMRETRPRFVFLAAAKVGGIYANDTYPAQFLRDNLAIEINLIHSAMEAGVENLMFLGSSCIYPRECPQPIKEQYLLTGALEPTNEAYAIAKIAGIKLCDTYNRQYGTRYVSVMPTNLYGPNDNYDVLTSHVIPALLRKTHEAKLRHAPAVVVWGSGTPRREFLYVDDLADACVFLMEAGIGSGVYNVGTGEDITIRALAQAIMQTVDFRGEVVFDATKPDGTPRKLLCVERMAALGWRASTSLEIGLARAYSSFLSEYA